MYIIKKYSICRKPIAKLFRNRRKGKYNFSFHPIKPYLFIDFLIIIWRLYYFIVIFLYFCQFILNYYCE